MVLRKISQDLNPNLHPSCVFFFYNISSPFFFIFFITSLHLSSLVFFLAALPPFVIAFGEGGEKKREKPRGRGEKEKNREGGEGGEGFVGEEREKPRGGAIGG